VSVSVSVPVHVPVPVPVPVSVPASAGEGLVNMSTFSMLQQDKIKFSRWMLDSGFGENLPTVHEDWADKMPDLPVVIKVASGSFGEFRV